MTTLTATWRVLVASAVAAALLAPATRAAAQDARAPLRIVTFCAGLNNLPMSDNGVPAGFEVEVAHALAGRLEAEARFVWLDAHTESFEQAVLDTRCDAALGAILDPGAMAGDRTLPGIALTAPYYSAGYQLVRRSATKPARTLSEVGDARIALEGESIATFTLRQRGHQVYVLRDFAAVVRAVADGRAAYGYLWGPVAAWTLRGRSDVVVAEGFAPAERWGFALAVRERDGALRRALDDGIRALVAGRALETIFAKYHVSYRAPNERTRAGG